MVLATSAEIIAQKLKAEKSKLCLSRSKLCLSEPMETFEQERIEILSLLENAKLMGYPKESLSKKEFFKKYRKLEWLQSNEEFVTQLSEAGLLR